MNEADVHVRYNTALMEQADWERYSKLRELRAMLDLIRPMNELHGVSFFAWQTSRVEAAAGKLFDELFPKDSAVSEDR